MYIKYDAKNTVIGFTLPHTISAMDRSRTMVECEIQTTKNSIGNSGNHSGRIARDCMSASSLLQFDLHQRILPHSHGFRKKTGGTIT
jgi:hypothetical protein